MCTLFDVWLQRKRTHLLDTKHPKFTDSGTPLCGMFIFLCVFNAPINLGFFCKMNTFFVQLDELDELDRITHA